MFALEYPFIPVSQSSLLQLIKCRRFCVHPLYKDNICTADQYDSKSPAVSHVEGRSSPAVVQWRPLDCGSYLWRKSHVVQDDFDSKSSDTPDRTWRLCFCPQYKHHTPHLQIQSNTEQDEQLVVLCSWVSPALQPGWCFYLKQVLEWRSVCTEGSCRLPYHPDPSSL